MSAEIKLVQDKKITEDRLWRFNDGRKVDIKSMDEGTLLVSSLHAMKMMHDYYKTIEAKEKRIESLHLIIDRCELHMKRYAEKMETLKERASELSINIPEDHKELQDMIKKYRENKQKQEA